MDFIEVYDDVLPAEFCQRSIEAFEASPYKMEGRRTGGVDKQEKESVDLYLARHAEYANWQQQIYSYTAAKLIEYAEKHHHVITGAFTLNVPHPTTGRPVKLNEANFAEVGMHHLSALVGQLFRPGPIQAQKYPRQTGGYHAWHSEVAPQAGTFENLHRVLFFMYYLNDVAEGGETEFFYQQRKVQPRQGRMVIAPAYFTHTHRGNRPVTGHKYILTSWILFNQGDVIYRQA